MAGHAQVSAIDATLLMDERGRGQGFFGGQKVENFTLIFKEDTMSKLENT